MVAVDAEQRLLVGECKWGVVTRQDLVTLRARAVTIAAELGSGGDPILALFSARDEADEAVRAAVAAGEARWFTGDDLALGGRTTADVR